ncbi:MAG: TonB-dependent receptor [Pseudomonadales bacterium]
MFQLSSGAVDSNQPQQLNHTFKSSVSVLSRALLVGALAFASQPFVMAAEPIDANHQMNQQAYNIPAGSLSQVLSQFAGAAGIALSFDAVPFADMTSLGLQGTYSVKQGFAKLLAATNSAVVDQGDGNFTLETASSNNVFQLENIVVSASRSNLEALESPQVVTIITSEQIEEQLAISTDSSTVLSNLLPAYTPSRQKLTGSGETFRGRTPLIMIDGVPQSNPLRATGRSAHTIDLSMVEKIEVIHGASAIHGLGATGGIINYITREPENNSFKQHIDIQTTTPTSELDSDTLSYKLNYRLSGRADKFDYLFGASFEDQGLFLDGKGSAVGVDNTQGDFMDSQTYDLFAKVGFWLSEDQKLGFQINQYLSEGNLNYVSVTGDRANGVPTTSKKGRPIGEAPRNKVQTISATYEDNDFAGMTLNLQAYNQEFEGLFGATDSGTFQDAAIAPVGTLFDQSEAISSKQGAKITLVKDGLFNNRLKLTGGFDVLRDTTEQRLALTNRSWVPESGFTNYAPFVQAEVDLLDNLVLHTGVRREFAELDVDTYQTIASRNSVTVNGGKPSFNETLVNFGLVYHPIDSVRLFANYSEGFGLADVGRVLRGINKANLDVDRFLDLKPIVTDNLEVGVRVDFYPVDLEFSVYQSSSDLGSRLERIGDDFFAKREKTEISGFETSAGYELSANHQLKLAYSYIKGEFDSDGNGSLDSKLSGLNISPNRLVGTWNARLSDALRAVVQVNHAFDRSFDDPEKEFNGYTTIDASLGYQLRHGKVSVSFANLLDEDYVTYYSQSALVNDDRYFKGRGRTLTLGYSLDF